MPERPEAPRRAEELVYRQLLRLYPRSFRREFRDQLLEAFRTRWRRARGRHGRFASPRFWAWILHDLLRSLRLVWPREGQRRSRQPGSPPGGRFPRGPARHPTSPGDGLRDLRHAVRGLRRQPGFALACILTLALGIGANTALFSVVDGTLLRRPPYPEPDRIVRLWATLPAEGIEDFSFTPTEYRVYREDNRTFENLGGSFPLDLTVSGGDSDPERLQGAFVTPGWFEVYGAIPSHGRLIDRRDVEGGDPRVVVLGHGLWQRRHGGDAGIVGGTILLSGSPFTVVGVLPPGFRHPDLDTDVYIPYVVGTEGWIGRWLELSARLRPGVTLAQARADLDALAASVAARQERSRGWEMTLEPLSRHLTGDVRSVLWTLMGAVGFVLALACANVTNLFLARATTRRREIAVRVALGAGRLRVARQSLVEPLLIAVLGGGLGVVLAVWGRQALLGLNPEVLPRLASVELDLRVLGFTAVATLVAGSLSSLAPALYIARTAPGRTLQGALPTATTSRRTDSFLSTLVIVEVALTLTLLVGAGLLVRSLTRLQAVDPGFAVEGVVAVGLNLPSARYPEAAQRAAFYDRVVERSRGHAGIEAAAVTAYLPLDEQGAVMSVNSEERWRKGLTERRATLQRVVGPGFFETLGIPLLAGRTYGEASGAEVEQELLVSASLVEELWPGLAPAAAVGRRVTTSDEPGPEDWHEIIGVVGDVRYTTLAGSEMPQAYESSYKRNWSTMTLVARSGGDPHATLDSLIRLVGDVDAAVPTFEPRPLQQLVGHALARPRFQAAVLATFAVAALILACAGLYGVVSFVTGRRVREISVRQALGASRAAVRREVLGRGMSLVGIGTALGLALSLVTGRLLEGTLHVVDTLDPAIHGAGIGVLAVVTLAALWLPARRASRVDPAMVLRRE